MKVKEYKLQQSANILEASKAVGAISDELKAIEKDPNSSPNDILQAKLNMKDAKENQKSLLSMLLFEFKIKKFYFPQKKKFSRS